jgi:uncharacterized repeat protein (TIGR03803 family)
LSLHDNQITRHANIACVIVAPRQSSSRRDRQNGHPDCRCVPIQIVALHGSLIADANGDLFGTTNGGGPSGYGTVFEIVKTALNRPGFAGGSNS